MWVGRTECGGLSLDKKWAHYIWRRTIPPIVCLCSSIRNNITLHHIWFFITSHNIWFWQYYITVHSNWQQKMPRSPIVCFRKYQKEPKPKRCIWSSILSRQVKYLQGSSWHCWCHCCLVSASPPTLLTNTANPTLPTNTTPFCQRKPYWGLPVIFAQTDHFGKKD